MRFLSKQMDAQWCGRLKKDSSMLCSALLLALCIAGDHFLLLRALVQMEAHKHNGFLNIYKGTCSVRKAVASRQ